jgi:16S rRNA pseudouridine516 synthase
MSKKITLYQALKQTGLFVNKKEMNAAIGKGRVTIDGKKTTALQFQFDPNKKELAVDNKQVAFVAKKYYLLNKPHGASCQNGERFKYVVDFIDVDQTIKNTLFSVGRLDVPTTGLVLITNDGQLGMQLMEPKKKVVKKYQCLLQQKVTEEQMERLRQGVTISVKGCDYCTLPAVIEKIDGNNVFVSIREGKHRQIRKMWGVVGNKIVGLCRVSIGGLVLPADLGEGSWVEVGEEVKGKKFVSKQ